MDEPLLWPGYGCRIIYKENVFNCARFPTGKQNYFHLAKILPEFLEELLGYKITLDSLFDGGKVEMYKTDSGSVYEINDTLHFSEIIPVPRDAWHKRGNEDG